MPQYTIDPHQGTSAMSISRLITVANSGNAGPTPVIPSKPAPHYLGVNEMGTQDINATQNPSCTSAIGLITCASVTMVSFNPNDPPVASVFHANAGVVSNNDLNQMRVAISTNPQNLVAWQDIGVVYAIARAWDNNYQAEITNMQNIGIQNNRIAWLENIPIGVFGINSFGHVGVPGR